MPIFKTIVTVSILLFLTSPSRGFPKKELHQRSKKLLEIIITTGRFNQRDWKKIKTLSKKELLSVKDSMEIIKLSVIKNKAWKNLKKP